MRVLNCRGKLLTIDRPWVMGIVNCTPDSFYENSRWSSLDQLKKGIDKHISEGADLLDLGAYSSRPNAVDISENEEIERLAPALEYLSEHYPDMILSVDTFRSKVARFAIEHGAHIVNDISGGQLDPEMFKTVGELQVPLILMHMRGTPQNMQSLTQYDNIFLEVCHYFSERIAIAKAAGVTDIILDPGFGFAKELEQNYEIFSKISMLRVFDLPILVGISRKSMIYKALNTSPEASLSGTIALNALALQQGTTILRVHDVKEARETVEIFKRLYRN